MHSYHAVGIGRTGLIQGQTVAAGGEYLLPARSPQRQTAHRNGAIHHDRVHSVQRNQGRVPRAGHLVGAPIGRHAPIAPGGIIPGESGGGRGQADQQNQGGQPPKTAPLCAFHGCQIFHPLRDRLPPTQLILMAQ